MMTLCVYDPKTRTVKTIPIYDNNLYWVTPARPGQVNRNFESNPSCPVKEVDRIFLPDDIKNLGKFDPHQATESEAGSY